jgi:hypothetical protein
MQNVDELKTRVEETTDKLRAFQEGRNGQSQSLVEMLGELEEKYAAQSVELEYCRDRIDPLETANTQLAILMESLLDTIDAGLPISKVIHYRKPRRLPVRRSLVKCL